MIHLFYGTDRNSARGKARQFIDILRKKRPDAEYFIIGTDAWSKAIFEEFIAGQGLFERKFIVFLDGVLDSEEASEFILVNLKSASESDNAFIFLEGKVDAPTVKKFEKASDQKVERFDKKEEIKPRDGFNIFSLADALARRDRKHLWVLYEQAILEEIAPEEINGVLFWQIKTLIQARDATNPKDSGLAPFAFTKAKQNEKNYSEDELKKMSGALLQVYHETRRGRHDFETALERFVLSI